MLFSVRSVLDLCWWYLVVWVPHVDNDGAVMLWVGFCFGFFFFFQIMRTGSVLWCKLISSICLGNSIQLCFCGCKYT